MAIEREKTLQALQTAIQMEIDGKEFYYHASQKSGNELGRKLLQSLASEEDIHRQKFQEIYNAIQNSKGWPRTDFIPDSGKRLRTILAKTISEIGPDIKTIDTELDAIQTAMIMENKTYDYYQSRWQTAIYPTEKDFYQTLASEEREHHRILLDYYEYLKDPAAWFVTKEHPSLDGG